MNQTKFNQPKQQYLIECANRVMRDCGENYTHYAITGHFGDSSTITTKRGYENKWIRHEKQIRFTFNQISRQLTGIRRWGKSSRNRELKVFVIPEIQHNLHLHGIMSLPIEDTEMSFLKVNVVGENAWYRAFGNRSFYAERLKDDGWMDYSMKTVGYGDIVSENFIILPSVLN